MTTKNKSTKKPKPATQEERLAHLEDRHNALIAQLTKHGIHLDLGEGEENNEETDEPELDEEKE